MPERCWIHSSLVSISCARSWLVTTRAGTYMPVPVILVRIVVVMLPPRLGPVLSSSPASEVRRSRVRSDTDSRQTVFSTCFEQPAQAEAAQRRDRDAAGARGDRLGVARRRGDRSD